MGSIISIDSLLSNFLSGSELSSLNSSGINITDFFKNVKNLIDNKVNLNFLTDINKLSSLGLNVKSLSDLEKVKDIDPNKIISNSIDIKSLQSNLSIIKNTGLDINSFSQQFEKVKNAGFDVNKITNLVGGLSANGLISNLTGQGTNIVNNLTSQGSNLLGNLTGQGSNLLGNLTGQGTNIVNNLTSQGSNLLGNLTGQGTNLLNSVTGQGSNLLGNLTGQGSNLLGGLTGNNLLKGSLTSNVSSQSSNTQNTPQNQRVETPKKSKGIQILVPSQYIDVYVLSKWGGEPALITHPESKQLAWYDTDYDRPDFIPSNLTSPDKISENGTTNFDINIHLGYPGGKNVGNWSEDGSQCFATADELRDFFSLCDKHVSLNGNKFSYTIATKNDWEQATKNVAANKIAPPPTTTTTNTATQESINQKTIEDSKNESIKSLDTNSEKTKDSASSFTETTKVPTSNNPVSNNPVSGTESNSQTSAKTTTNKVDKPSFFRNKIDVMAFQVWCNKNGISLSSDGEWGEKTNSAWLKLKIKYIESLRGLTDSNLRLVHARLQPYGMVVPITEYSKSKDKYVPVGYTYTASFSKNKLSSGVDYSLNYTIVLYDTDKFKIIDNFTRQNLCSGVYLNGARMLRITEGINANKLISEDNAWTSIKNCLF